MSRARQERLGGGGQGEGWGEQLRRGEVVVEDAQQRLCPDLSPRGSGSLEEDCVERDSPRAQHRRPDQFGEAAELDARVVEGEGPALDRRGAFNSGSSTPRRSRIFTPEGCTPWVEAVSLGNRARSTRHTLTPARTSKVASGEPAHRAPTMITSNRSAINPPYDDVMTVVNRVGGTTTPRAAPHSRRRRQRSPSTRPAQRRRQPRG